MRTSPPQPVGTSAMFFRYTLFYTVDGSIIGTVAQALGAGFGVTLFAALLVPPLLHIVFILYRR